MEENSTAANPASKSKRVFDYLGLERNTGVISATVFLIGVGEELWKKFLPKYLEALGASAGVIGLFGTSRDFLDAIYQYPGGWLADRVGRRRAFLLFITLAFVGYAIYLFSPSWHFIFIGLVFASAWQSMGSPAIFAVIADALPKERRAMGFTLQSILKRVPSTFAPVLGGMLIASFGVIGGVRAGLIVMLALAVVGAFLLLIINLPLIRGEAVNFKGVWRSFHGPLKKLLLSDIIIRMCEGMAEIFIVLYAINVIGIGFVEYSALVALQMLASIIVYIPAARVADRIGRKPFVIATFACFALYPVAVSLSFNLSTLALAFVIGGLREIGEPSRKAMIVDFAEPHLRGRTVGLYYLVRSLAVTPAALIGGFLWQVKPQMPFVIAGIIGIVGTVVFAATVEEKHAG